MATGRALGDSAILIEITGDKSDLTAKLSDAQAHVRRLREEAGKPGALRSMQDDASRLRDVVKALTAEFNRSQAAAERVRIDTIQAINAAKAQGPGGADDIAAARADEERELKRISELQASIALRVGEVLKASRAVRTENKNNKDVNIGMLRFMERHVELLNRKLTLQRIQNDALREEASLALRASGSDFKFAVGKARLRDAEGRAGLRGSGAAADLEIMRAKMRDLTTEAQRLGGDTAAAAERMSASFAKLGSGSIGEAKIQFRSLKSVVDRALRAEEFTAARAKIEGDLRKLGSTAIESGRISAQGLEQVISRFNALANTTSKVSVLRARSRDLADELRRTGQAANQKGAAVKAAAVAVDRHTARVIKATRATRQFATASGAARGQLGGMTRALGGMRSFIQPGVGGLSSLSMGLYGLHPAAGAAAMAIATVKSSVEQLFEAGKEGAQMIDMREAFEKMSGIDPLPLVELRDALKGTVDDQTLMRFANLGRQIGVAGKDIPDLAKVAKAAAQNLGESTEFMYESIMKGTARRERRILDNLGIGIENLSALYRSNAATMGKSVQDLTKEEKDYIFINEVLKRSELITAAATDAKADSYYRLETRIKNTTNTIKEAFAMSLAGQGEKGIFAMMYDFDSWSKNRGEFDIGNLMHQLVQGQVTIEGFSKSMSNMRHQEDDQRFASNMMNIAASLSPVTNGLNNLSAAWSQVSEGDVLGAGWSAFKAIPVMGTLGATIDALVGPMSGETAFGGTLTSRIEEYIDPASVMDRADTMLGNLEIQMKERFAEFKFPEFTSGDRMPLPFSSEVLGAIESNFDEAEALIARRLLELRDAFGGGSAAFKTVVVQAVSTSMSPAILADAVEEGLKALGVDSVAKLVDDAMYNAVATGFSAVSEGEGLVPDFNALHEAFRVAKQLIDTRYDELIEQTAKRLQESQTKMESLSELVNKRPYAARSKAELEEEAKRSADLQATVSILQDQKANAQKVLMERQNLANMFRMDREAFRKAAAENRKKDSLTELFMTQFASDDKLNDALYDRFKTYDAAKEALEVEVDAYAAVGGSIDKILEELRQVVGSEAISAQLIEEVKLGKADAVAKLQTAVYSSDKYKKTLEALSKNEEGAAELYHMIQLAMGASVKEVLQYIEMIEKLNALQNRPKAKTKGGDPFKDFANLIDATAASANQARKLLLEEETPLLEAMNKATASYDKAIGDLYKKRGEILRHKYANYADLAEVEKTMEELSAAKKKAVDKLFRDDIRRAKDTYIEDVLGVRAFAVANEQLVAERKKYKETMASLAARAAQSLPGDFALQGLDLLTDDAPDKIVKALRQEMDGLNGEQQENLRILIDQLEAIKSTYARLDSMAERSRKKAADAARLAVMDEAMKGGDLMHFDAEKVEQAAIMRRGVAELRQSFSALDDIMVKVGDESFSVGERLGMAVSRMESGAIVIRQGGEAVDEYRMKMKELSDEYNTLAERFNLDTVTRSSELGVESMLFGVNSMLDMTEWRMEEWASSVGSFSNTMINDVGKILGVSASMAAGGNTLVGGLVQGAFTAVGSFVNKLFNWNKSKDANVQKAVERLSEKKRDVNVYMTLEHHGLNINAETARNVSRAMRKAIESGERI